MKHDIKIGTSGYSYDDWRGNFYPENIKSPEMLAYYCRFFTALELNVTYYTIPPISTFERICHKTPERFDFIVKTNQETTHRRRENEPAIAKLLDSVQPLIEADKFHGFLAQFPYSFKNTEENRKYLVQTRQLIGKLPLFVEFRHNSWSKDPVNSFLSNHDIGYVNVDEPQLAGLLAPQTIVTSQNGYIRFHGRNSRDWWEGKGSARYDYEYKENELEEWLIHISNILKKAFKTYIFFNNHPGGKAVKNAEQMLEILRKNLDPKGK